MLKKKLLEIAGIHVYPVARARGDIAHIFAADRSGSAV
jgi:hypothetical protein